MLTDARHAGYRRVEGGGAERVCINPANAWAAQGKHATILTISQNKRTPAYAIDARVELRDLGWPRCARPNELNHVAICSDTSSAFDLRALPAVDSRHNNASQCFVTGFFVTRPDVAVAFIDRTNVRVLAAMAGNRCAGRRL